MGGWWNAAAACPVATIVLALVVLGFTESGGRFFRAMPIAQPQRFPGGSDAAVEDKDGGQARPGARSSQHHCRGTPANASSRYTITMRFLKRTGGDVGAESGLICIAEAHMTPVLSASCSISTNCGLYCTAGRMPTPLAFDPSCQRLRARLAIHHMDIFACQPTVIDEMSRLHGRIDESKWCRTDAFLDKLPAADLGIRSGCSFSPLSCKTDSSWASPGFSHMVLQLHYLLPDFHLSFRG